ncbi:MAG: ribbon-helix-helix protein, CopG family [Rubrobacteraceae bacterium]
MARTTKVISVSVPAKLAKEMEEMAKEEGISKSELIRQMARAYKQSQASDRLARLQRELGPGLRAGGIRTEEDVDRFVFEDR